jgi:hypothetical protein
MGYSRPVQFTVTAIVLSATLATGAPVLKSGVRVIRTLNDTIWVHADTLRVPIAVSKLAITDTLRVVSESPVRLVTALDTAVVPISRTPMSLYFASGPDTTFHVFFHVREEEEDSTKLALLRGNARFGHRRPATLGRFTYSSPADSPLVRLRLQYDLAGVAGTGDDLSRMLRLMHWVHGRVRHDGTRENPLPLNALHLLDVSTREGATCNCRGLGTILNEVYLASGYRSRILTCLPADLEDTDCHVVDIVWLPRESRWVMMDPTHDAWFADRRGRVLGPAEVRAAMVRGDSLRVPDTINWNGQPVTRTHYLNYMAKNLFRFSSPLVSAFGYEFSAPRAWEVCLEPSGYRPKLLATIDSTSVKRAANAFTDDESFFWARPRRR